MINDNDIWCVSKWSQPWVGVSRSDEGTEGVVPLTGGQRTHSRVTARVWPVLQFLAQLRLQAAPLAHADLSGLHNVLAMPRMLRGMLEMVTDGLYCCQVTLKIFRPSMWSNAQSNNTWSFLLSLSIMLTSNSSWEIIFFLMSVFRTMSAMWPLFSWISCSSLALMSLYLVTSLSKQLMTWPVSWLSPTSPITWIVLVKLSTCSSLLSSKQLMRWMFSSSRETDSLSSLDSDLGEHDCGVWDGNLGGVGREGLICDGDVGDVDMAELVCDGDLADVEGLDTCCGILWDVGDRDVWGGGGVGEEVWSGVLPSLSLSWTWPGDETPKKLSFRAESLPSLEFFWG